MEPCPFACGRAARQTQLQQNHGADSTTERRSSSQRFRGTAGIPRVVVLGMSLPFALVESFEIRRLEFPNLDILESTHCFCLTRIRGQFVVYFCCHYRQLCRKRRQHVNAISEAKLVPKDSGKAICQAKSRQPTP